MFSYYIEYISQKYTNSLGCTFIPEMGENYVFPCRMFEITIYLLIFIILI